MKLTQYFDLGSNFFRVKLKSSNFKDRGSTTGGTLNCSIDKFQEFGDEFFTHLNSVDLMMTS